MFSSACCSVKNRQRKPNQEGMECWVDTAHASEWNNKTASNDPNTARSRMGYVITYAGCPMHWSSKMQTEIALSTTEAEYIALSQAMRVMHVASEAYESLSSRQWTLQDCCEYEAELESELLTNSHYRCRSIFVL